MKASELFHPGFPCNAAETVFKLLEETAPAPAETGDRAKTCGALRAALALISDPARAAILEEEFVKLTGAADCGILHGPRCSYYVELAAELVRKYRRSLDPNGKIRVLLLGDSIRGNYQNFVREGLGEHFEVVAPEENGRFAKYTLNELDRCFQGYGEPDVIHWNNGLWDSAVVCPEDGMFTPPDEYLRYMSLILRELRKHTPNVIFATTTPVRDGSLNQHLEYIDRLNAVIVPYMKAQHVAINDLYSLVKPRMDELLRPDCIHLSAKGCEVCGQAVIDAIHSVLAAAGKAPVQPRSRISR